MTEHFTRSTVSSAYKIIRSHRDAKGNIEEVIVASGLDWEAAEVKRNQLNEAERSAHPYQTSWTRDLFYCQMEKPND